MITFVRKGMLTLVQDLGRYGYQRYGVPVSGVMDEMAARLANRLVGNDPAEAVLECTVMGPTIEFGESEIFALAGADFGAKLNGEPIDNNRAHLAHAGDRLEMPAARFGARAYIAFAGGFDLKPVMGSLSTYLKAGIGGLDGRAIRDGDTIPLREAKSWLPNLEDRVAPPEAISPYNPNPTLRFTYGPQDDMFSEAGKKALTTGEYKVSNQSDRMGYRLEGPQIEAAEGCNGNIISDGICIGSIQVPSGQPIVLMADRQTTGGYAKIGCVIRADLPLLAQLKAGDTVRFEPIEVHEAQKIYLNQLYALRRLAAHLARRTFTVCLGGETHTVTIEEAGQ